MEDRKTVLLRAAYDLLQKASESYYVEETLSILIHYDGTECDGACLMEDIAIELGIKT